jgi:hypothetical protein
VTFELGACWVVGLEAAAACLRQQQQHQHPLQVCFVGDTLFVCAAAVAAVDHFVGVAEQHLLQLLTRIALTMGIRDNILHDFTMLSSQW